MKKTQIFIGTLALALFLVANNSFALSLGMYINLGGGSGEAEYDFTDSEEFDFDTGFFGLGFKFETDPLFKKRVFSYRFQAGIESRDIEGDENETLELGGLVINNTFAFGRKTSETIYLWIGPQVSVGFYSGETDEEYLGDEISFSGVGVGIGVAGGANFKLGGGNTILTTTLGLRSVGFSGEAEWYAEDEDFKGNAAEVYLSLGIYF